MRPRSDAPWCAPAEVAAAPLASGTSGGRAAIGRATVTRRDSAARFLRAAPIGLAETDPDPRGLAPPPGHAGTATCKQQGIDAFAYLRDVFDRVATHPGARLEELLPHRWQAARQAAVPASARQR